MGSTNNKYTEIIIIIKTHKYKQPTAHNQKAAKTQTTNKQQNTNNSKKQQSSEQNITKTQDNM